MAYSKESNAQKSAMSQFNQAHWEKDQSQLACSDLKYTSGEMDNPQHLSNSVEKLSNYVKKHKMSY